MDAGRLYFHSTATATPTPTPHECGCLQWPLTSSKSSPIGPQTAAAVSRRHSAPVAAASSSFVAAARRQHRGRGAAACCIAASLMVAASPPAPIAAAAAAAVDDDTDGDNDADGDDEASQSNVERRLVSGERVLQISKADFTVSSVLDKIKRGKLDLRPSYQRDYVWDKKTASKLIESLLLNIPLPTMFFHEKSQGQLEVVDGKQRLTSIWCFMEEEIFPDGSDFALCGLDVLCKLNGKKYSDLEDSLQEIMRDFALNVHTISRNSDDEVVFEVFERLNMGSTQLNEQELRNCVFQAIINFSMSSLIIRIC